MSVRAAGGDYFDRARSVAIAILVAAAAASIIGSLLDWVTITRRPRLAPNADFGAQQVEEPTISQPYTGIEARDGWVVIGAAGVLVVASVGLGLRRRSFYAALAFVAAMVIGAVAFADYRGVGDLSSSISERMEIVGDPEPGIGIILVAVAGIAALIGAVLGLIATPSNRG